MKGIDHSYYKDMPCTKRKHYKSWILMVLYFD